jgi:hypothetical protein
MGSGADAALEMIETGYALLAEQSFDTQSHVELLDVQSRLEVLARKHPAIIHTIISRLSAEADPKELGGKNLADLLATALRISIKEAKRRIKHAQLLGPRTAMTGESLAPQLPNVAAAQARGEIGAEHLGIITKFFKELPVHIDYATREAAEAHLAQLACGLGPDQFRQAADRLAVLLNQDGAAPDDAERARRRYLSIGKQQPDGMSEIRGLLDPQCRATVEAVLAKLAAPGMCNPDDNHPCIDDPPDDEAARSDTRSPGQRNHDALTAMGRALLASGKLGQLNGLPATIIVTTSLQDLHAAAGVGVTAGGTLLPMHEVIRLASQAHHYLVIYDHHNPQNLYCGRAQRLATPGQRIVLHALDRGCTKPGCTAPGYWCQVHHVNGWATTGGQTNITELTLACGPDNRLVDNGGWTTRKRTDGRTEWLPPPHLDTGQTRINNYHHPDKYLLPQNDEGP